MRTTVINIRTAPDGWQRDSNFVYIGRAGKGFSGYFGNPMPLEGTETREALLNRYKVYLRGRIELDKVFAERIQKLRGKTLVCFCKPYLCHGDVIADYLEGRLDV